MKLKITVDQKTYEVDVEVAEDDRGPVHSGQPHAYMPAAPTAMPPVPPPAAGQPASGGAAVDENKVCRSPVAGVVVRVNAQGGQQIQANDPLLVLEAMKMETNITSPFAGKVKAVNVQIGDGVQVGQILVEFE